MEVNDSEAKLEVGDNEAVINAIAANIVGALLYPTGLATLQTCSWTGLFCANNNAKHCSKPTIRDT